MVRSDTGKSHQPIFPLMRTSLQAICSYTCWKINPFHSLTTTTTTTTTFLFFNSKVHQLILLNIIHNCLNMNFSGRWTRRRGPITWLPCSPDLTPLDFFLWDYVKDHVYSQRVNMPDELKAWITAAFPYFTKDMLQCVLQEVDYRWDVCSTTGGAHYGIFHT
jgi:hypothetical protein